MRRLGARSGSWRGIGLALVTAVGVGSPGRAEEPASQPASGPASQPAASRPARAPGTVSDGIYFEEISVTLRDGMTFGLFLPSPHDPNLLIGASGQNHIFLSQDGGRTFAEVRLPGLARSFFGAGAGSHYPGALRRSDAHELAAADGAAASGSVARGRLGAWLAGAGRPAVGRATIGSTLAGRGARTASIWFPLFHPTDPKIVWAFTLRGLYVSEDGGWSFMRRWIGTTPTGSETYGIAVDPANAQHMLLATGEGLQVSWDGGRNFVRHGEQGIGDWLLWGAMFHPGDPRYAFAVSKQGLLRSRDGGRTWHIAYLSSNPMGRNARWLAIDPFDPDHALLDTSDGMRETRALRTGGLDTWDRSGRMPFAGNQTKATTFCPVHRGHVWTLAVPRVRPSFLDANDKLLNQGQIHESLDGGRTWRPVTAARVVGEIFWFSYGPPEDPDLLSLHGAGGTFRMRRGSPSRPLAARRVKDVDPPIGEVLEAALHHTRTHVDDELGYRRRARFSALMPRLQASFRYGRVRDRGLMHDMIYWTLPFRRQDRVNLAQHEVGVMLRWDLGPLVFSSHAPLIGREARTLGALRSQIIAEVQQAHRRLRELRVQRARVPAGDLRTRLHYRLRIEQSVAYLDQLTGGLLSRRRK